MSDASMPEVIDVHHLHKMREAGEMHQLVDVREGWELEIAALDGADHIPMGEVVDRMAELSRDKPLVIMCRSGGRSGNVVGYLRSQGFDNATNLAGGILDWSSKIDPSKEQY
ncbi:MAG: hypothetical protein Alpg2KO_30830 [Alphaproteobacteria bacterium]